MLIMNQLCVEMALQHAIRLPLSYPFSPLKENVFRLPNSLAGMSPETEEKRSNSYLSSSRVELFSPSLNFMKSPLLVCFQVMFTF